MLVLSVALSPGNQVAENFILPYQLLNVGDLTIHGVEMRIRGRRKNCLIVRRNTLNLRRKQVWRLDLDQLARILMVHARICAAAVFWSGLHQVGAMRQIDSQTEGL